VLRAISGVNDKRDAGAVAPFVRENSPTASRTDGSADEISRLPTEASGRS